MSTAAVVLGGIVLLPSAALADTTTYEFKGSWVDAPQEAVSGKTVLQSKWMFDINDSALAPGNAPVANNTLRLNLKNGVFTDVPGACLAAGTDDAGNAVNPASSISPDGSQLICNLGTRMQGTAEVTITGILAVGSTGSKVSMSGTFADKTVTLPEVELKNIFTMNAKFNRGAAITDVGNPRTTENVTFPFSLSHGSGAPAGPDTVEIGISLSYTGSNVTFAPRGDVPACGPNSRIQSGYPYSDDAHDPAQTAKLPTCTLESTGEPNQFKLTLSNLDYTSPGPRLDSNGQPLPLGEDVVAAGNLNFELRGFSAANAGIVSLSATEPTYTASDGQTAEGTTEDDDNENSVYALRGDYNGGWVLSLQRPKSYPGTSWTNTSIAPVGATVLAMSAVGSAPVEQDNWVCQILDTEYVTFEKAHVSFAPTAQNAYLYGDSDVLPVWYYTGEQLVNPGSTTPVSENDFECGGITDPNDPAAGNQPGWSLTPPSDLSTVKAVKVRVPVGFEKEHEVTTPFNYVFLSVDQRIKDNVEVGQDIWSWTSVLYGNNNNWKLDSMGRETFARTDEPTGRLDSYTETPGLRYKYTAPMRDVLRTVGSEPFVQFNTAKNEYLPNTQAQYHLQYGLESNLANPDDAKVVALAVLPEGLTYAEGSAPTEPTLLNAGSNVPAELQPLFPNGVPDDGLQRLLWTFDEVTPNASPVDGFDFSVNVPADSLGKQYQAGAFVVSQGIRRFDTAEFLVPVAGHTSLAVNSVESIIDLKDVSGAASPTFTVNLRSADPIASNVTDVIDVLPYVGDQRGTAFTGALKLKKVTAPAGATVYYTTVDPKTVNEDPADDTNGGFGKPSAIWSDQFTADATAIRIVGGELAPGATQTTKLELTLSDPNPADRIVNLAAGRTESTALRMRSSAGIEFVNTSTPPAPPVAPPAPPVLPPVPSVTPPAPPVVPPAPPVLPPVPSVTPPAPPVAPPAPPVLPPVPSVTPPAPPVVPPVPSVTPPVPSMVPSAPPVSSTPPASSTPPTAMPTQPITPLTPTEATPDAPQPVPTITPSAPATTQPTLSTPPASNPTTNTDTPVRTAPPTEPLAHTGTDVLPPLLAAVIALLAGVGVSILRLRRTRGEL